MPAPSPGIEVTRVRLPLFGEDRELSLRSPAGPATLPALLPTARELSDHITTLAVARAEAEGQSVSCRAGCAACCRQLVPISVIEARALARAVDALPPARREAARARFTAAVARLERLDLLDPAAPPGRMALRSGLADPRAAWGEVCARYFAAQIPCPLLEDERCSLYEDRPLVCREYLVTTPAERCARLDDVRAVKRPLRASEALATAAREFLDEPLPMLPLPLSLEWTAARGALLDQVSDGENLMNHLLCAADEVGADAIAGSELGSRPDNFLTESRPGLG